MRAEPKANVSGYQMSGLTAFVTVAAYLIYPIATLSVYKIFYALILMGVFLIGIKRLYGLKFNRNQSWSFNVFVLVAIFSLLYSKYPKDSIFGIIILLPFIFLFLLSIECLKLRGERFLYSISIWLPIVLGSISTWMVLKYGTLRPETYAEAISLGQTTSSFSNEAASMVEGCYPLLFYFAIVNKRKTVPIIALLMSFFVLIASQSRGAILGLIIFFPITIWMLKNSVRKKTIRITMWLFILSLISMIMIMSQLDSSYLDRIIDRSEGWDSWKFNQPEVGINDYARYVMVYEGINAIQETPFVGIGFNGLNGRIEDLYGISIVSHNILITVWGEMGILGLISFTWLVVFVILRFIKYRVYFRVRDNNLYLLYSFALIAFVLVMVHGLFRPLLTSPMLYFLIAIAFTKPLKMTLQK